MHEDFKRTDEYGFNYVFERILQPNEMVIAKMPSVTPNKRGINDIGWQTDGNATLYGTLSSNFESENALWQEIRDCDEINKTVSAIKVINGDGVCNVVIRAILN